MPCWTHGGSPRQAAPTSARKAVEVTLWTSYTLLCAPRSAFITRGSRGPANFTMALWKQATPCRAGLWATSPMGWGASCFLPCSPPTCQPSSPGL